jgi:hypothetical protein
VTLTLTLSPTRCDDMARYSLSHTQLAWKDASGGQVDDYREAYSWLRRHTAADARVLAWWDLGLGLGLGLGSNPNPNPNPNSNPNPNQVGLRLPDLRYGSAHDARRRQHVEPLTLPLT